DMNTPFIVTTTLFMLSMAGVALINMPIMTAGINALPDHLIPHGTSVINTARQFGGSIGLTFIISFISLVEASSTTIDSLYSLTGVDTSFFVAILFAMQCLYFLLFIKNQPSE